MRLLERVKGVTEMVDNGLRVSFGSLRRTFWPVSALSVSRVNIQKTRNLYRNSDAATNLGSGFVRRIINAVPEYMSLPYVATGSEETDELLNHCIHQFWPVQLTEMVRDACRDTKVIARLRRGDINTNPLLSDEEVRSCYIEVIPPEQVEIFYRTDDKTVIDRALVTHIIEEIVENGDMRQGKLRTKQHVIIEQITATDYTYWDQTEGKDRPDLNQRNDWGFVPLVEVFNEWDAYLESGQSDLESSFVFIKAFHDVLYQTLLAHKHHSIPKATFQVNDVGTFLANNFPEAFEKDELGRPIMGTFNGKVSWKGTEILFFQPEEGAKFLEATSVLGDSKTLLDFLLDCISMSSETPKFVLMHDVGAVDHQEALAWAKKIQRKRLNFTPYFQMLCKMCLAVNKLEPVLVPLTWPEIDPESWVTESQSLQQVVMSLELAAERELISDTTAREYLRKFIPNMKSPTQEATDAKSNIKLAAPPNSPDGRAASGSTQPNGGAGE
jgi:hypothetical protein